jgi:hypothetical protein
LVKDFFFVKKNIYVEKNPGVWKRNLALRKRNWAFKKKEIVSLEKKD